MSPSCSRRWPNIGPTCCTTSIGPCNPQLAREPRRIHENSRALTATQHPLGRFTLTSTKVLDRARALRASLSTHQTIRWRADLLAAANWGGHDNGGASNSQELPDRDCRGGGGQRHRVVRLLYFRELGRDLVGQVL